MRGMLSSVGVAPHGEGQALLGMVTTALHRDGQGLLHFFPPIIGVPDAARIP